MLLRQDSRNEKYSLHFFSFILADGQKIIVIELYRYHLNRTSGYCFQRPYTALTLISGILQIWDPKKKQTVALPALIRDLQLKI